MLIKEKLKQNIFSPTEQQVITYLLAEEENILPKSIRQLASETFSSPTILVRIAKKAGYTGWKKFKEAFISEIQYLNSHFEDVNANIPFANQDNLLMIIHKMARLYQTTIQDSLSLIKITELQKAFCFMKSSTAITVFGNNVNLLISQDFALKMNRIKKHTFISSVDGEQPYDAANCPTNSCAIIISYSGETSRVLGVVPILQTRKIPIIAITNIGHSSLSQEADCILHVTTREKLYSKIGNFSSNLSITFILDILYAGYFSNNYQENFDHLIKTSKLSDPRTSNVDIIREV